VTYPTTSDIIDNAHEKHHYRRMGEYEIVEFENFGKLLNYLKKSGGRS
jgi:hypothetical protein